MTRWNTQLVAADAVVAEVAGVADAELDALAEGLAGDPDLDGVGRALACPPRLRHLLLATELNRLALPPASGAVTARLASSPVALWRAVAAGVDAVRAEWTAAGGL